MGLLSILMSLVEETKLLPDDRDSQTVWLNVLHDPAGMIPARARLTPNSANCPATSGTPLLGFCAAVRLVGLTPPSALFGSSGRTVAPQHGGRSFPTKQAPLVTQVRMLNCTALPPPL